MRFRPAKDVGQQDCRAEQAFPAREIMRIAPRKVLSDVDGALKALRCLLLTPEADFIHLSKNLALPDQGKSKRQKPARARLAGFWFKRTDGLSNRLRCFIQLSLGTTRHRNIQERKAGMFRPICRAG